MREVVVVGNGITLHAGVRVVRIDRFAHRVYGDDGSIVRYDKLVLPTGSRSYFPPTEGSIQTYQVTVEDGEVVLRM